MDWRKVFKIYVETLLIGTIFLKLVGLPPFEFSDYLILLIVQILLEKLIPSRLKQNKDEQ